MSAGFIQDAIATVAEAVKKSGNGEAGAKSSDTEMTPSGFKKPTGTWKKPSSFIESVGGNTTYTANDDGTITRYDTYNTPGVPTIPVQTILYSPGSMPEGTDARTMSTNDLAWADAMDSWAKQLAKEQDIETKDLAATKGQVEQLAAVYGMTPEQFITSKYGNMYADVYNSTPPVTPTVSDFLGGGAGSGAAPSGSSDDRYYSMDNPWSYTYDPETGKATYYTQDDVAMAYSKLYDMMYGEGGKLGPGRYSNIWDFNARATPEEVAALYSADPELARIVAAALMDTFSSETGGAYDFTYDDLFNDGQISTDVMRMIIEGERPKHQLSQILTDASQGDQDALAFLLAGTGGKSADAWYADQLANLLAYAGDGYDMDSNSLTDEIMAAGFDDAVSNNLVMLINAGILGDRDLEDWEKTLIGNRLGYDFATDTSMTMPELVNITTDKSGGYDRTAPQFNGWGDSYYDFGIDFENPDYTKDPEFWSMMIDSYEGPVRGSKRKTETDADGV